MSEGNVAGLYIAMGQKGKIMNQTQKHYAVERVNEIFRHKESELKKKLTRKGTHLNGYQCVSKIRSGKVKMFQNSDIDFNRCRMAIRDIFDFSPFEEEGGLDRVAFNKAIELLSKKAREIKDKIMLGDAEKALKMIHEFEAM